MMKRRNLLSASGLCLAALASLAQPVRKVYRIGILSVGASPADLAWPNPTDPRYAALLGGLRALGYVYGEHFVTEPRGAEGQVERFPGLVAELIRLQVDVVVAAGPALAACKQATSTLPIVMAGNIADLRQILEANMSDLVRIELMQVQTLLPESVARALPRCHNHH